MILQLHPGQEKAMAQTKQTSMRLVLIILIVVVFLMGSSSEENDSDPVNPGDLLWVKHVGGASTVSGSAITSLSDNSTVVTGSFWDSTTFGDGESNETVLVSPEYEWPDIFIARYNPDSTLAWVKRAEGGTRSGFIADITALSDDSTVVTGSFWDSVTFGEGELNQTILVSAGHHDIFVARYNPDGTLAWASHAAGPLDSPSFLGITTLSDDSVVVTGTFDESVIFGDGEPKETTLESVGRVDIFVARYYPDGTLAWTKSAGGGGEERNDAITTLSDDSIVISGYFCGSATFGSGEPNETTLASAGIADLFVARYNPDGTLEWAIRASGANFEAGYGITTLSDDSIVVTGHFKDSATFGEWELNETILVSAGTYDDSIFVARYNTGGTLTWAKHAGGPYFEICLGGKGLGITTLSDDSTVVIGTFCESATFGEGEQNETTLTSEGESDIFIARFAP